MFRQTYPWEAPIGYCISCIFCRVPGATFYRNQFFELQSHFGLLFPTLQLCASPPPQHCTVARHNSHAPSFAARTARPLPSCLPGLNRPIIFHITEGEGARKEAWKTDGGAGHRRGGGRERARPRPGAHSHFYGEGHDHHLPHRSSRGFLLTVWSSFRPMGTMKRAFVVDRRRKGLPHRQTEGRGRTDVP